MMEIKDGRIIFNLDMDLKEYERLILGPVEDLLAQFKSHDCSSCLNCEELKKELFEFIERARSIFING